MTALADLEEFDADATEQSNLLLARVQIASDENHEFSLHLCDVGVLGSTDATSDGWLFS